jgi:hypothetical protein
MSLTALLLFTLPNAALGEEGDEGCDADWYVVESEGPLYLDGVGCVVGGIDEYCDEYVNNDCKAWDQAVALYDDSPPGVKEIYLLDCAEGSDYAHRWNQSSSAWEAYQYFDEDGFAAGHYYRTFGDPWCCAGIETTRFYYGDPNATCIEPTVTGGADTGGTDTGGTDTGDTGDTPKTGPCGGGSGGSAAVVLFAASSLLTARRRRQP